MIEVELSKLAHDISGWGYIVYFFKSYFPIVVTDIVLRVFFNTSLVELYSKTHIQVTDYFKKIEARRQKTEK